jgi:ankyrin repeat protein
MTAAQSGDVPTFKYLLDHGGDLTKADDKGLTVLHHAVAAGASPDRHSHLIALIGQLSTDYLLY